MQCKHPGCNEEAGNNAKGYCRPHYAAWMKDYRESRKRPDTEELPEITDKVESSFAVVRHYFTGNPDVADSYKELIKIFDYTNGWEDLAIEMEKIATDLILPRKKEQMLKELMGAPVATEESKPL